MWMSKLTVIVAWRGIRWRGNCSELDFRCLIWCFRYLKMLLLCMEIPGMLWGFEVAECILRNYGMIFQSFLLEEVLNKAFFSLVFFTCIRIFILSLQSHTPFFTSAQMFPLSCLCSSAEPAVSHSTSLHQGGEGGLWGEMSTFPLLQGLTSLFKSLWNKHLELSRTFYPESKESIRDVT